MPGKQKKASTIEGLWKELKRVRNELQQVQKELRQTRKKLELNKVKIIQTKKERYGTLLTFEDPNGHWLELFEPA